MANVSYKKLLAEIETFATNHWQIKKFGSDFVSEMPNFATKDEKYPILFIAPVQTLFNMNTTTFIVDAYAWDIIQKDRENINTILSDTSQILNDLYRYFIDGDITGIDLIASSPAVPINNGLLDYASGWQMTLTFDVNTFGLCEIPMD